PPPRDVPAARLLRLPHVERRAEAARPGLLPGAAEVLVRDRRHVLDRYAPLQLRAEPARCGHEEPFRRGGPVARIRADVVALLHDATRALPVNTSSSRASRI